MNKKVMEIGLISSFIIYPVLLIAYFILNLFQNKSFNFFGFSLAITDVNQVSKVNLSIKPEFLSTFILVFVFIVLIGSAFIYIKDRNEVDN